MSPEQQELFRKAILKVLDRNRSRFGLGIPNIAHALEEFGFSQREFGGAKQFHEAILYQLDYLSCKNLVEEVLKNISKENRAWRISTAGIAYLDEQN